MLKQINEGVSNKKKLKKERAVIDQLCDTEYHGKP